MNGPSVSSPVADQKFKFCRMSGEIIKTTEITIAPSSKQMRGNIFFLRGMQTAMNERMIVTTAENREITKNVLDPFGSPATIKIYAVALKITADNAGI